jgi:hypothetical protein
MRTPPTCAAGAPQAICPGGREATAPPHRRPMGISAGSGPWKRPALGSGTRSVATSAQAMGRAGGCRRARAGELGVRAMIEVHDPPADPPNRKRASTPPDPASGSRPRLVELGGEEEPGHPLGAACRLAVPLDRCDDRALHEDVSLAGEALRVGDPGLAGQFTQTPPRRHAPAESRGSAGRRPGRR